MKLPSSLRGAVVACFLLPAAISAADDPRIAIGPVATPGDADSVYRIDRPGSYYLTGNLYGAPGKSGIEIATSGVTIDLNGFRVQGLSGSVSGIRVWTGTLNRVNSIVIRNGTIAGWGGHGISLGDGSDRGTADTSLVESVHSSYNGGAGIAVGDGATVRTSTASHNRGMGIVAGESATIDGSTAVVNAGYGFSVSSGVVRGSTAKENGQWGIFLASSGVVVDSIAQYNLGGGFRGGHGSVFERCVSESNEGIGFEIHQASRVSASTARQNKRDGIRATGAGSIISNNVIHGDPGVEAAGIFSRSANLRIQDNQITGCQTGISLGGQHSRVTGNFVTGAALALKVQGAHNLILANTFIAPSGGRHFEVVLGNRVGTVVAPKQNPAFGVNTSGTGIASTDPLANFAY